MANHLKEIREGKGLAQRAVTALSGGVSTATISAIEKWDYLPNERTRSKVAAALGVDVVAISPAAEEAPNA